MVSRVTLIGEIPLLDRGYLLRVAITLAGVHEDVLVSDDFNHPAKKATWRPNPRFASRVNQGHDQAKAGEVDKGQLGRFEDHDVDPRAHPRQHGFELGKGGYVELAPQSDDPGPAVETGEDVKRSRHRRF